MNILFLSTENPFPVDHGHHIRTFHNLSALAGSHHIHFVCFDSSGKGEAHRQELAQYCRSVDIFPLPFHRSRQIRIATRNLLSPYPVYVEKYSHPELPQRLQTLIDTANIDLVHFDLLHLAHLRKFTPRLPAILVNHNVESLRMLRWANIEKNPLLRSYLRYQARKLIRYESRVLQSFDHCIAVSEDDRQALAKMSGFAGITVLPNGVDAEYFQPVDEDAVQPGSIVWAGSMNSPYNRDAVDYFLHHIWPLLCVKHPDVKASFLGKSPTATLQKLAQSDRRITAPGFVEDVRPHVARAEVFIAPLRSGSGTKIKVLNAMAQAKPVVTTAVGAEGISARDGEEIVIADDPAAFARAVAELLKHPQRARQIGKNARKVIERQYDRKKIEQETLELYDRMYEFFHRNKKAAW